MIVLKIFFPLLLLPLDTGSLPLLQPTTVPLCRLFLLAPRFFAAVPQRSCHRAVHYNRQVQRVKLPALHRALGWSPSTTVEKLSSHQFLPRPSLPVAPSITSPLPKASRARLPWLGLRGRWPRVAQGPPGVLKARTRLAMLIWLVYENQIWLIYENRYKLTISTTQSSPVMFDEEYRK